jgi:hypothetical protein
MFVFKALLSWLLYSLKKIRYILQVLETFFCYSEIWSLIYMEVTTRIGISCEPFCLDSAFSPAKLFFRFRYCF